MRRSVASSPSADERWVNTPRTRKFFTADAVSPIVENPSLFIPVLIFTKTSTSYFFARQRVCSSYTSGRAAISRASPKSSQKPSIAISPFIPFFLKLSASYTDATANFLQPLSSRVFATSVAPCPYAFAFTTANTSSHFPFIVSKFFFSRDKSTSARHLSTLFPRRFFSIYDETRSNVISRLDYRPQKG